MKPSFKKTVLLLWPCVEFLLYGESFSFLPNPYIPGCLHRNVDLILVGEDTGIEKYWQQQIRFFSRITHEFLDDGETAFNRLRVALLIADRKHILDQEEAEDTTTKLLFGLDAVNDTKGLRATLSGLPSEAAWTNVTFKEPAYRFAIVQKTSLGVRPDALTVVVMVQRLSWKVPEEQFLRDLQSYRDPSGPWLVLVVRTEAYQYLSRLFGYNVDVHRGNNIFDNEVIVLFGQNLCRECPSGWFPSTDRKCCFHLAPSADSLSWIEAQSRCRSVDRLIDLANIPTKELLVDLEGKLHQRLLSEQSYTPSSQEAMDTAIFIGLRRNTESFSQRFEWQQVMTQGNRLFYPRWFDGEPDNRNGEDCVIWTFKAASLDPKVMDSANESLKQVTLTQTSGWQDVPCHQSIAHGRALCFAEPLTLTYNSHVQKVSITPMSPRRDPRVVLGRGMIGLLNVTTTKGQSVHFISPSIKVGNLRQLAQDPRNLAVELTMNGAKVTSLLHDVTKVMPLYRCHDDLREIPYLHVCDRVEDCLDNSDETICLSQDVFGLGGPAPSGYRQCVYTDRAETMCNNDRHCVTNDTLCDTFKDCEDGTDESNCLCQYFQCSDGLCIPNLYGRGDCINMRDNPGANETCVTTCNKTACVTPEVLSNGVTDCHGPEGHVDQVLGALEAFECPAIAQMKPKVSRWAPKCVYIKDRFGEMIGCPFSEHLDDCADYRCPEGYAKCPKAFCIPVSAIQDGVADCPLQEDEDLIVENIDSSQRYGLFKCTRHESALLHPDLVCDGLVHCPGGEDEAECDVTCAEGFFCLGGAIVVNGYDTTKVLDSVSFLDHRLRYIDLSHVPVPDFFHIYPKKHLRNVLELYLSDCSISTLEGPTFQDSVQLYKDLLTVMTLDLSKNQLSTVGNATVLSLMPNLQVLNLSHNVHLDLMGPGAVSSRVLRVLDLSWTAFTSLDRQLFSTMPRLVELSLRGTNIMRLASAFPEETKLQVVRIGALFHSQFLDLRDTPLKVIEGDVFQHVTQMKEMLTSSYRLCCAQIRGETIPELTCHAPLDVMSSCSDMIRDPAMRVLLWVVGLVALIGNAAVMTMRLVVDRRHFKKSYGLFVAHLSLSDFLMGIYLVQIAFYDVKYRGQFVLHSDAWTTSAGCKAAGFLSTLSSETSALFILLITVDRFLVIRFPLGQYRLGISTACVCSTIVWAVAFLLALLPTLPPLADRWHVYDTNAMCLGLPLDADRKPGWQYSQAVFVAFNFVLFLLIAVGQYAIYRSVSLASASRMAFMGKLSEARRKQEVAVARHLSLVVLSDFLCWFPIGIMGLLTLTGHDISRDAYAWTMVLILPVNSALNPILYTLPVLKQKLNDSKKKHTKSTDSTAVTRGSTNASVSETSMRKPHDVGKILLTVTRQCRELNDLLDSKWRRDNNHLMTVPEEYQKLQEEMNKIDLVLKSNVPPDVTSSGGSLPSAN